MDNIPFNETIGEILNKMEPCRYECFRFGFEFSSFNDEFYVKVDDVSKVFLNLIPLTFLWLNAVFVINIWKATLVIITKTY